MDSEIIESFKVFTKFSRSFTIRSTEYSAEELYDLINSPFTEDIEIEEEIIINEYDTGYKCNWSKYGF